MEKTTVYLTRDLKRSLERLAAATGRSEADLVREAVRSRVGDQPPRPHGALFSSGNPSLAERAGDLLEGFGEH